MPELELPEPEQNGNEIHILQEDPEREINEFQEVNLRELPWVVMLRIFDMFRLNNLRARDDDEDIKRGADEDVIRGANEDNQENVKIDADVGPEG